MAIDRVSISKVYVIESLDEEVKTGKIISELISGQIKEAGKEVPVEFVLCETKLDFSNLLVKIKLEAEAGEVPLLQIECHGDKDEGLIFSNGSSINWIGLMELVAPINIATGFNLVLCLSACDAGHFLGRMGRPLEACPCRVLVAPSAKVWPHECMSGFRRFYYSIFDDGDLDKALKAVESSRPENGAWICEIAERWFFRITTDYFKNQCNRDALDERARAICRGMKARGVPSSFESIRRDLLKKVGYEWLNESFIKFFAIDVLPENKQRFKPIYDELESWIARARAEGTIGF